LRRARLRWPTAADVTVFAAASLKNALDDATKLYEAKTGDKVAISYAASPGLAKQIEAGAPAHIFFSADLDWMDYLAQKNLIDVASRKTLLGNTLVLVAPKDSAAALTIGKDFPLLAALGMAMASVDSVPAGKYGKAALTNLWVWDAISPRVVQAENVRAALVFVAKGEAPLGIERDDLKMRRSLVVVAGLHLAFMMPAAAPAQLARPMLSQGWV
jgi:molybdate transport system substrate-binding protein